MLPGSRCRLDAAKAASRRVSCFIAVCCRLRTRARTRAHIPWPRHDPILEPGQWPVTFVASFKSTPWSTASKVEASRLISTSEANNWTGVLTIPFLLRALAVVALRTIYTRRKATPEEHMCRQNDCTSWYFGHGSLPLCGAPLFGGDANRSGSECRLSGWYGRLLRRVRLIGYTRSEFVSVWAFVAELETSHRTSGRNGRGSIIPSRKLCTPECEIRKLVQHRAETQANKCVTAVRLRPKAEFRTHSPPHGPFRPR
ncbi:hypothetical protein C8R46DRAFT_90164 [Mycena filopes]|nr:hypothetical protein C8R46DRAFT_90164 [Mycena filopes]